MKHRWLITILSILAVAGTAALAAYLLLPKSADYERLVGRWLRPDGGYILDIKEIQPDGKVVAVYLNPRPI